MCECVKAGIGIWKVYKAKKHIAQICKLIQEAKHELINETGGVHHRPGDEIITRGFEEFITNSSKLQVKWDKDHLEFIHYYSSLDLD